MRPNGFSIRLVTEPAPHMCDVCTSQQCDEGWIQTFVGDIPQSDVCLECARDVAAIVRPPTPASVVPVASGDMRDLVEMFTRTGASAVAFEKTLDVSPINEPTFPCPDCGRTFARPAALGSHARSHKTSAAV